MAERQVQARLGDWQPYAQLVWAEKRGFLFNAILTVPMILFFLPVLFVVILGPAIINITDTIKGG